MRVHDDFDLSTVSTNFSAASRSRTSPSNCAIRTAFSSRAIPGPRGIPMPIKSSPLNSGVGFNSAAGRCKLLAAKRQIVRVGRRLGRMQCDQFLRPFVDQQRLQLRPALLSRANQDSPMLQQPRHAIGFLAGQPPTLPHRFRQVAAFRFVQQHRQRQRKRRLLNRTQQC